MYNYSMPLWLLLSLSFALISSLSFFIVKKISQELSTFTLIFGTAVFQAPFMLLFLIFFLTIPRVTPAFYLYVFLSSLIDFVAAYMSFWAIKHSPISLLAPISSFNPVFTLFFALIFLQETATPLKFLGVFCVIIGAYLLNVKDIQHGVFKPIVRLSQDKGVQMFMGANFLWAITPILQKKAIWETSPQVPLFVSFFGTILMGIYLTPIILRHARYNTVQIHKQIKWLLLLAPFGALAQWAAFNAFSLANVGYVTAIFKLSTLFTIVLGVLFFKEKRLSERLLGAAVMLAGALLIAL